MTTKKFIEFIFIFLFGMLNVNAQEPAVKSDHVAVPTFGETSGGTISIQEHLEDSLLFTDSLINARYRVASFNLALKCNGNVVKYLENKSGNKLTAEMKEEVLKLHSNCTITFDGIKMVSREKDPLGKYSETKLKPLQLKIKM